MSILLDRQIMNKKLTTGLIAGLLVTNLVTVYTSTKIHNDKVSIVKEQESEISELLDINSERNSALKKQESELNTYKVENEGLTDTIKEQQNEINTLKKDLTEARQKQQSSP